jgi:hypothetical protein
MEWIDRYPFESEKQAIARVTTQHLVARLAQDHMRLQEKIEEVLERLATTTSVLEHADTTVEQIEGITQRLDAGR